jgi:hypothetical protein
MLRLLRPPLAASFVRSFRLRFFVLHWPRYARETIAQNMLASVDLVTASFTQTASQLTTCSFFTCRATHCVH